MTGERYLIMPQYMRAPPLTVVMLSVVHVAIGARVNDDGAVLDVGDPEPRRQDGGLRRAVMLDDDVGQIAQMTVAIGSAVASGLLWVEMSAGRRGGHGHAARLGGPAIRRLVNMDAVRTGLEARQIRLDQQTVLAVFEGDEANQITRAALGCLLSFRRRGFRQGIPGKHRHAGKGQQPHASFHPAHFSPSLLHPLRDARRAK